MSCSVVTIGSFDGVHVGHRALIERARAIAVHPATGTHGQRAEVVALAFEPSPQSVLTGVSPPRLSTWEQRVGWLMEAGADRVERLEPTRELLGLAPHEFIESNVQRLGIIGMVEGPDFRFGKGRAGDAVLLRSLGQLLGFRVEIVEPVDVPLNDHLVAPARSTTARWLLEHGRVADAAIVLGRPFQMRGIVVQGDRRGRTIGFPTANIESTNLIPGDGVYAGVAHLPDDRRMTAAISVGTKPTFGHHRRAVEAHLWEGAYANALQVNAATPGARSRLKALDEYGWELRLDFIGWIREQARFSSPAELLAQMTRDCARVDRMIEAGEQAEVSG